MIVRLMIILIAFQMILIEFKVRLIMIMIRMTMTMIKCPMTMTMIKCPMTMTVNKCPMNMIMIMIWPQQKQNITNELKDVGIKDKVLYKRDDNMMTKVKWSIETNEVDNDFMREYDDMCKSMEDRQINDMNEARRHIQSAMMGDTQ